MALGVARIPERVMWTISYDDALQYSCDNTATAAFFIHKAMNKYRDVEAVHRPSGRVVTFTGEPVRLLWISRRLADTSVVDL